MARDPFVKEFEQLDIPAPSHLLQNTATVRYTWNAPEYIEYTRGRWWYVLMCASITLACAYALYSGSFILLGTILLFLYVYYLAHRVGTTRQFPVYLTDTELIHTEEVIPYVRIEYYYFLKTSTSYSLHLKVKKYLQEKVIYLPEEIDIQKIRSVFPALVKEQEDPTEDLMHYLARLLKL